MSKVLELVLKIKEARKHYYNGSSIMSDKQFDTLIDQLSELDPTNPEILNIGSEPVSNWEKYTHKTNMGSLFKAQTTEEYSKWHKDNISTNDEVILTPKLDGLSLSLIYENGVLKVASTRGNNSVGENILSNIIKTKSVPLKININATIRGEIVLPKDNFKHFSSYSNSRNAASGVSRRYDGTGCEYLDVVVYQLETDDLSFTSHKDSILKLKELGFKVPEFFILKTEKEVLDLKSEWQNSIRENYQYDIDGLVAHVNNLDRWQAAGIVSGRPKASIALKFDSISKEATVSDIIVQVGNSGRITPVAVFSPKVNLMGADIEKASLHNFSNIKDLGIDIGAKVLVCRSGDVIPFVEEVVESTGSYFKPPIHCPECNSTLIMSGEYLECKNNSCIAREIGKIKNYIKELNILEFGDILIEKLVRSGKVKTISDLYKLSIDDVSTIDRMGKKSAKNSLDALHAKKELPLHIFLGALSIPMVGSSTIKIIIESGISTIEDFFKCSVEDFEKVNGLGLVKANNLFNGLELNKQLIEELFKAGITIKQKPVGIFTGKSICFTGSMKTKRALLENMVTDNGGDVKSSVSKTLSYLVIDDVNSKSSKAINAKKFGISLLSEDDFLQMIGK